MINLYHNQTVWEQQVVREEVGNVAMKAQEPVKDKTPSFVHNKPSNMKKNAQRRLTLPASDPLHRLFDQMTQPDCDLPKAAHLRRNFSLTERRRSSLLRGLFNRTSLKPASRGRVSNSRPLQSKENRLPEQTTMDLASDDVTEQLDKTEL